MLKKGIFALLLGGSIIAQAAAQESSPAAQGGPQAATSGTQDIIVTAQKREQKLQDVGLSITAVGAEALANQRIQGVADLAKVVPGLTTTPSPNSTPVYTLRGVGFFESSLAATPDVAIYMDQAPFSLPAFSTLSAFDLERIEVLKGPQGTLFGANATGGAINFIAAKPTRDFKAGVDLGYGRFNTVELAGFVSGPLSDTLLARFAVKAVRGDEWQRSYTRDDKLGKTNTTAARLLLDWRPSDRASFLLNVNGWRDKSDPQAPQIARPTTPADLQVPIGTVSQLTGRGVTASLPILNFPAAPRNARAADWSPAARPYADVKTDQVTLNATYDILGDVTITSLTSYTKYKHDKAQNLSGSPLLAIDNTGNSANATAFSEELRLANSGAGPFRWVVGGNFEKVKSYEQADLVFSGASGGFQQGFSNTTYDTRQNVRRIAAFGNVEYDLSDRLTAKAGIRYTNSRHRDASRSSPTPGYVEPFPGDPTAEQFLNAVFGGVYTPLFCPGVVYQYIPGTSYAIDPDTCATGTFRDTLKENNTSWRLGFDYKATDDLLLYVNVSKGYKAGAFPAAAAANQAQFRPVVQESVIDYEAGFKSTISNIATINGSVFYYDYRNKQLRSTVVDPLFDKLDNLVNVPKSVIKGAELELSARPLPRLSISAAATYVDAKIKRFQGITGSTNISPTTGQPTFFKFPVFADFNGVRLPFAPKYQFSFAADYSTEVASGIDAFVGGNLAAQTKSFGSPQLTARNKKDAQIDGYATLDLRAGFGASDDRWKITFWGRNITNKYYWTNSLRNYDTIVRYTGRPAEYGVTAGLRL
ncbi:TonB-dependent receptor [Sphingobium sp. HWE2-09]|uniref:TonB-dependent receptor n=1 Tax=Sphingobium sp. HWE2-09 TaxID=3108390 RepID=UPI002DCC78BB|nr:TonB-dependent receptor [Sphingobium sp. HWE2-09]